MNAGAEMGVWGDVDSKGPPLSERHSVSGGRLGDPQSPNSRPEQRVQTAAALLLPTCPVWGLDDGLMLL